jgi:hypothetical protein
MLYPRNATRRAFCFSPVELEAAPAPASSEGWASCIKQYNYIKSLLFKGGYFDGEEYWKFAGWLLQSGSE